MILDRLSRELFIGDKVAYQSFKSNGLAYGEITQLLRTRAAIKSLSVDYSGVTDYREYGSNDELVSGYDIIKVA